MTFWSNSSLQPIRKRNFIVSLSDEDFSFLAKEVNKPTLETEVNEYRLGNQIVKFPSVPRWNDITIKYVDTTENLIYKKLLKLMMSDDQPKTEWEANAIENNDLSLTIDQYDSNKKVVSTWRFKNAFIKSINFGDNNYSDDSLSEIEVVIAYDWAYLD